MSRDTYQNSR